MTIKNILWVTDGSKQSDNALEYAKYFSKSFNSKIFGLHVVPIFLKIIRDNLVNRMEIETNLLNKIEAKYNEKYNSIEEELKRESIDFSGTVLSGIPSNQIVNYRKDDIDLIVTGVRGVGLIDNLFIGSTTLKVLRETPKPVLAVGNKVHKDDLSIKKILVPLDVADENDVSLEYAVDLSAKLNAKLSIVYVFSIGMQSKEVPSGVLTKMIDITKNELESRVERSSITSFINKQEAKDIAYQTEVVHGINAPLCISDYVKANDIDLIVMNSSGKKGLERIILGSVAEKVVQNADCPVLVLKN